MPIDKGKSAGTRVSPIDPPGLASRSIGRRYRQVLSGADPEVVRDELAIRSGTNDLVDFSTEPGSATVTVLDRGLMTSRDRGDHTVSAEVLRPEEAIMARRAASILYEGLRATRSSSV